MWFKNKYETPGKDYTIPQIDLSVPPENLDESLRYLFTPSTVDEGQGYLGHPDSVLLKNGDILTFFPRGTARAERCRALAMTAAKPIPTRLKIPRKVGKPRSKPRRYTVWNSPSETGRTS